MATDMYNSSEGYNIEINGFPFFAESIEADEFYNRRDPIVNNIIGGTQQVMKGAYIARSFSFITHVLIDPDHPDVYNDIFREMMAGKCEIISPELGGLFGASVIIKPLHKKPRSLELSITINEIPEKESNIPGDVFIVPEDKLEDVKEEDKEKEKVEKEVNPKKDDKSAITSGFPRLK
jgi:hypothetical protein